jgi:hypothetical protein
MFATLLLFSAALFSVPQCPSDAAPGTGVACSAVNCSSAASQKQNANQDAFAKPSYLIEVIDPAIECCKTDPKCPSSQAAPLRPPNATCSHLSLPLEDMSVGKPNTSDIDLLIPLLGTLTPMMLKAQGSNMLVYSSTTNTVTNRISHERLIKTIANLPPELFTSKGNATSNSAPAEICESDGRGTAK